MGLTTEQINGEIHISVQTQGNSYLTPTSQKAMVNATNMNMFAHTEIKVRAGKAVTIECDMTSRID